LDFFSNASTISNIFPLFNWSYIFFPIMVKCYVWVFVLIRSDSACWFIN
jgi:hypothetical protein